VEIGVGRAGEAVHAGMTAASVRIDRVPKRHPRFLRDLVDRRAGADLVEAGVEGLRGVEGPNNRGIPEAGQLCGALAFDFQVVPAHEPMFAQRADVAGSATIQLGGLREWSCATQSRFPGLGCRSPPSGRLT